MISAVSKQNQNALSLFKLALLMRQSQNNNIPMSLQEYFIHTLNQARLIAEDPSNISNQISPEAIELAVDMLNGLLGNALEDITDFEHLTPEIADAVLQTMEVDPVHQSQFSPLAGLSS